MVIPTLPSQTIPGAQTFVINSNSEGQFTIRLGRKGTTTALLTEQLVHFGVLLSHLYATQVLIPELLSRNSLFIVRLYLFFQNIANPILQIMKHLLPLTLANIVTEAHWAENEFTGD
ncbi:unnamed protein product [Protopolystoma xenopodis]|uniref:Uncharacterized protein n=1 Tax=Protopolystoma xenopodis TaxID=117903 RepID=A0A3S5AZA6_9PLAT|nr:unnamed protein product [Protopolystoma xenopodis]